LRITVGTDALPVPKATASETAQLYMQTFTVTVHYNVIQTAAGAEV